MIEFKEGMICFSGGNSFMQRAIKFFTNCNYSHSFVVIKGPGEILSALETTSTLVCPTAVVRKYSEKNYIECWEYIDEQDRNDSIVLSELVYLIYSAEWYAYLSYPWFMYRWLCRLFKHEPKTMWECCNKGISCTELTVKSIPAYLRPRQDENTISPDVLRDHMKKLTDKFRFVGYIQGV